MLFNNIINEVQAIFYCDVTKRVFNAAFVGITIDEKLFWIRLVDNIFLFISRNIENVGIINKVICLFSNSYIVKLVFNVHPPTLKLHLNRIALLQKKRCLL